MIFDLDFDLAYDRDFDKSHTTEECKVDSNGYSLNTTKDRGIIWKWCTVGILLTCSFSRWRLAAILDLCKLADLSKLAIRATKVTLFEGPTKVQINIPGWWIEQIECQKLTTTGSREFRILKIKTTVRKDTKIRKINSDIRPGKRCSQSLLLLLLLDPRHCCFPSHPIDGYTDSGE